jgi:hypothetical protein
MIARATQLAQRRPERPAGDDQSQQIPSIQPLGDDLLHRDFIMQPNQV